MGIQQLHSFQVWCDGTVPRKGQGPAPCPSLMVVQADSREELIQTLSRGKGFHAMEGLNGYWKLTGDTVLCPRIDHIKED